MIRIELPEHLAAALYDEVVAGALPPLASLSRYERVQRETCREVIKQLQAQGVGGVLAKQWTENAAE